MNCREASSLLSLYLDGELDDLRRKRVQLHIQKCPACSHDLATLAKTVRVIRAAAALGPDGELLQSLQPRQRNAGDISLPVTVNTKAKARRQHE